MSAWYGRFGVLMTGLAWGLPSGGYCAAVANPCASLGLPACETRREIVFTERDQPDRPMWRWCMARASGHLPRWCKTAKRAA